MATTEARRSREQLNAAGAVLTTNRDRCLFTLDVNAAFCRGDLLALNVGDVLGLKAGGELVRKEQNALYKGEF